ncbi:MAG: hypothetical protein HFI88_02750 [Lachnospiraceae bacterium]|nr:hypothetical protein [Lachnospiraceae bacterium]
MEKENREHKDSLFVDLFYQDETAKKNLLSLYNALHDTDYQDEAVIRKVKIEDVLYKNFKNDISFEVNGQVLVLGEHQSTVNPNMPLRCLLYVGRAYEQLVDKSARYRTTLVEIPTPEFYTFYNGEKEFPLEQELSLSDAFINPAGDNSVELKVKVININSDKAHKLLEKCGILREYSQFIDAVRKYSFEERAIKKAIKECIDRGILAEYLKRKGSEVENMLIAEYSYEEDIQVKQQEARRQGIDLGRRQGIDLGRQQGMIQGTISTLRDFGQSDIEIQGMIMKKYGISFEEAKEYLEKAF